MRWLAWTLKPVVPEFSSRFTTVIGNTVYLPDDPENLSPNMLASTMAHELVHQLDQQRYGVVFYLSYGLGMPTGRTMRAYWERRAYAVDLMLAMEHGGPSHVRRTANRLVEIFCGSSYFWMWAGRISAAEYLRPIVEDVLDETLQRREPYRSILAAWRGVDPESL
ncbi:MAG: hypothetical protein ACJAZO_004516 [Myxococcota bacterium]|jgi:hypothetical protein